jgi:type IV pilus assembly protein PilB
VVSKPVVGRESSSTTQPVNGGGVAEKPVRTPWPDRWLLDAFRALKHPAVEKLTGSKADCAWDALEAAGASPEEVLDLACAVSSRPAADLSESGPDRADLLDGAVAIRYGAVPVRVVDGRLEVACANPLHPSLEADLEFATGRRVVLSVASPTAIRRARELVFGQRTAVPTDQRFSWVLAAPSTRNEVIVPVRGKAVETLDQVVMNAVSTGASDIHFEPTERGLLVRCRVDGILHDVAQLSTDVAAHLISRLKVMANLDIANRKKPQDGSASVIFDGRPIDLRVSTLPLGSHGEKAVIRILDPRNAISDFSKLGYGPGETHRFEKLLASPEGLVLVTGPTGSGKTTTLYSGLRYVQSQQKNIVTVEDPIEYRIEGVNQVQVHDRSGLTFAAALRSILRQDPDVVLVGEIRDRETAEIALKAGMTGHLVLSTLHTNDAVSTITRLVEMGVDRASLSGALKGIVAQRLVRRLCIQCSQPVTLAELPVDHQQLLMGCKVEKLRKSVGCAECLNTGYRGRIALAEVLTVNEEVARAIAQDHSIEQVVEAAKRAGMRSLWESGLERVTAGTTTIHELIDNVASPTVKVAESQSTVDEILARLKGPQAVAAVPFARAAAPPPRARPTGPRLLLVDDDRADRRTAREELERAGYTVIEAADGEAAVAYARRLKPDAIVTDVALPKLDAVGLLQALQGPGSPPVLVYTRQTDEVMLDWLRELGASDVLNKASEPETLIASLRARLGPV